MAIRKEHARPVALTEQQLEQVTGGFAINNFCGGATTGSDNAQSTSNNGTSKFLIHDTGFPNAGPK